MEQDNARTAREFLLVSDFDQTLSFNDSGIVLAELLVVSGFEERIAGLSRIHMVQQGGELAYLLLHDPEFRRVRREHLVEAGNGNHFSFYVVSAAPEEVIQSAMEGVVPADRIYGTRFRYAATGEIESIVRVSAGYGKVAVLEESRGRLRIGHDRIVRRLPNAPSWARTHLASWYPSSKT